MTHRGQINISSPSGKLRALAGDGMLKWGDAGEESELILVFVHVQNNEAWSKETAGICWLVDFSLDRHDPFRELIAPCPCLDLNRRLFGPLLAVA